MQMNLNRKIIKTTFSIFIFLILSCLLPEIECKAANDVKLTGGYAVDGNLYLYVNGADSVVSGKVQIGTKICEEVYIANSEEIQLPVYTTIIFDNSYSMGNDCGEELKTLLTELIQNHSINEYYRLAFISDTVDVISDYSNDYNSLIDYMNEITYIDQDTYLTDLLYDLLEEQCQNRKTGYYRYLVITDGADDKEIGYTQNELITVLQNSGIPVYTIGKKTGKNSESLEQLFSYSRYSNASSMTCTKETESAEILDLLGNMDQIYCLKVVLPEELQDGNSKKIQVMLETEQDEIQLSITANMPFYSNTTTQIEDSIEEIPSTSESEYVETETVSNENNDLPVISLPAQTEHKNSIESDPIEEKWVITVPLWCYLMIAGLIILIVLTVVLILYKRKKKAFTMEQMIVSDTENNLREQKKEQKIQTIEQTVMFTDGNSGLTQRLWSNYEEHGTEKQKRIRLTNLANDKDVYIQNISESVQIGRSNTDIVIENDRYISGRHCEVYRNGDIYMLRDLGSANGTKYDGIKIRNDIPIMSGGVISIGKQNYRIDIVEE